MPDAGCRMQKTVDAPAIAHNLFLPLHCFRGMTPTFFAQRHTCNFGAMSDLEFMWQVGSRQELIPGIIYAR